MVVRGRLIAPQTRLRDAGAMPSASQPVIDRVLVVVRCEVHGSSVSIAAANTSVWRSKWACSVAGEIERHVVEGHQQHVAVEEAEMRERVEFAVGRFVPSQDPAAGRLLWR
jgi:hypothetical protein